MKVEPMRVKLAFIYIPVFQTSTLPERRQISESNDTTYVHVGPPLQKIRPGKLRPIRSHMLMRVELMRVKLAFTYIPTRS